jgi:hypothetical protein
VYIDAQRGMAWHGMLPVGLQVTLEGGGVGCKSQLGCTWVCIMESSKMLGREAL